MKRNLERLSNTRYDLVVIGGGISGAAIAWDAALRGLRVALLEKDDFGGATSANSLKTVHGGLRYLQDANIRLMRKMITERKAYLKIAPHLVHPLPFLMPTHKKLMKSKLAMTVALKLNDLISMDRNRSMDPIKALPNGHLISRHDCLDLLPDIDPTNITGGAIWYDAQIYNTERMLLSFVLSAAEIGTDVANYVQVTEFLRDGMHVNGVRAVDKLTGQDFTIQSNVVVNAAGAWVDGLLDTLQEADRRPRFPLSVAVNMVTRQIIPDYAIAVPSDYTFTNASGQQERRSNVLIMAPWQGYSIVGTFHSIYEGKPDDFELSEADLQHYINEANTAYPGAALKLEDIRLIHKGFLPIIPEGSSGSRVKLIREAQIHDHKVENDIEGLITAVGVKYTTARKLAQRTVDMVYRKLSKPAPPCTTAVTPLYGGDIDRFDDFLVQATKEAPDGFTPRMIQHLVYNYGSRYTHLLKYLDEDASYAEPVANSKSIIKAEILHAIREEMAYKLSDVILRRVELGAAGYPGDGALEVCAAMMAQELGWDYERTQDELNDVRAQYKLRKQAQIC